MSPVSLIRSRTRFDLSAGALEPVADQVRERRHAAAVEHEEVVDVLVA
jgi:hypothetical protein